MRRVVGIEMELAEVDGYGAVGLARSFMRDSSVVHQFVGGTRGVGWRKGWWMYHGEKWAFVDNLSKTGLSPPEPAAHGKARIDFFISSFACAEEWRRARRSSCPHRRTFVSFRLV